MTDDPTPDATRLELARTRLRLIDDRRAALLLHESGEPDVEIARRLATTERRVRRLRAAAAYLGVDPTAEELILRAAVDGTDRAELVGTLSSLAYTVTAYLPYPVDGSLPGTWHQIRHAYMSGYLTRGEFESISRAAGSPPQQPTDERSE